MKEKVGIRERRKEEGKNRKENRVIRGRDEERDERKGGKKGEEGK